MNDMNNDGSKFRVRDTTLMPAPLARPFGDPINIGIQSKYFDTIQGGRVEGNNNNGDFVAASRRTPLRQEVPVLFMRPLDN